METLEQDFKKLAEQHLPAHLSKVLQEKLLKAEEDAKRLEQANKTLDDNGVKITELNNKISEYKKFDDRNSAIEARESAVTEAERNLKVQRLEYELSSEKSSKKDIFTLVETLVKNPRSIELFEQTRSVPVFVPKDQYGNPGYHTSQTETTIGSNEKKETKD